MTTLFSGSLRPFPGMKPSWTARQQADAFRVLRDLVSVYGAAPDVTEGADYEDFWEDACRVSAALRASDADFQCVPEKTSWSTQELGMRMGPVSAVEEGGRHARDRQLLHPVLLRHGGAARAMSLLTLTPEEELVPGDLFDVGEWMRSRYEAGVSRVVLKNAERKGGVWVLDTRPTRRECVEMVFDELDWLAVRIEGGRDALLGADFVDMRFEYRCFVVDGKVVSSAGCVEEHTPFDADPRSVLGPAFQTVLREHRGHLTEDDDPALDQPEIAARLLAFARQVASEHRGTVVIDVALDASRDVPVVVELNELPNSGLFATDPWLVHRALSTATDRGYVLPVRSSLEYEKIDASMSVPRRIQSTAREVLTRIGVSLPFPELDSDPEEGAPS